MGNSDPLFELIKSLNKHEKIYFKVYCKDQKGSTKNYLGLFDEIIKQDQYDEKKIKEKFKNELFIRQLPVAKDYLFKMIMKSLRSFNEVEPSPEVVLKKMINDLSILFAKGLYKSCNKIILKAKKIAEENEEFLLLLKILETERKVLIARKENALLDIQIQENLNAQLGTLEKHRNTLEFQTLFNSIAYITSEDYSIRNKTKMEEIDRLIQNPLLQNPDSALTFLAKWNYYIIHEQYHALTGDLTQSYTNLAKLVELFELKGNENFMTKYREQYLRNLLPLSLCLASACKEEEFNMVYDKMVALLERYPELKVRSFPITYISQSAMLLNMGKFSQASAFADNFEKEMTQFKGDKQKAIIVALYFHIAYLFFGNREYYKALDYLNRVIADTSDKNREDVHTMARILYLIIYYELGYDELLDQVSRSLYRYLLSRKRIYKFEEAILDFIRNKIPRLNRRTELMKSFKVLHQKFVQLSGDDYEKRPMDSFEFISWLESKIENRSFAEIYLEKVEKKRLR